MCRAADSAIKNPVPNDIAALLRGSEIRAVFTAGKAAARLRLDDLIKAYRVILEYL